MAADEAGRRHRTGPLRRPMVGAAAAGALDTAGRRERAGSDASDELFGCETEKYEISITFCLPLI